MPTGTLAAALLDAHASGGPDLASAVADLAAEAALPGPSEPLGSGDALKAARARLRRRLHAALGWTPPADAPPPEDVPEAAEPPGDFDPAQLAKGERVEMEHTDDPALARQIARDHLAEHPEYYDALERMEAELGESATAVSATDFPGQQSLQVTGPGGFGRHGHRHLEEDEGGPAPDPVREFATAHLLLPDDVAGAVLAMGRRIDPAHLVEPEDSPHLTSLYGLHGEDADLVRGLLDGFGPVRVRLGKTSVFPASESGEHDVVKVEAEGDDLHRLHALLCRLPHTRTHPRYQPHVTLGYVRAGEGGRYAGMTDLDGAELALDRLEFSDRRGRKTLIPLTGPGEPDDPDDPDGPDEPAPEDAVLRGDLAARTLADVLAGRRPFSAACLADLFAGLDEQQARRVMAQAGVTEDELAALAGPAETEGAW